MAIGTNSSQQLCIRSGSGKNEETGRECHSLITDSIEGSKSVMTQWELELGHCMSECVDAVIGSLVKALLVAGQHHSKYLQVSNYKSGTTPDHLF